MSASLFPADPRLDLVLERVVPVPKEKLWKAWTTPAHLMKWFTPDPWKTIACEIELRPGGRFYTVMKSPEGQEFPSTGCYLDVVPNERLVWTNVLAQNFRPHAVSQVDLPFTCALTMTAEGAGTRYRAHAMHGDEAVKDTHAKMGFESGWGTVLDQLVAMILASD